MLIELTDEQASALLVTADQIREAQAAEDRELQATLNSAMGRGLPWDAAIRMGWHRPL